MFLSGVQGQQNIDRLTIVVFTVCVSSNQTRTWERSSGTRHNKEFGTSTRFGLNKCSLGLLLMVATRRTESGFHLLESILNEVSSTFFSFFFFCSEHLFFFFFCHLIFTNYSTSEDSEKRWLEIIVVSKQNYKTKKTDTQNEIKETRGERRLLSLSENSLIKNLLLRGP